MGMHKLLPGWDVDDDGQPAFGQPGYSGSVQRPDGETRGQKHRHYLFPSP